MAYSFDEPNAFGQNLAETSTTQIHSIGKIARAKDPTYGLGEFIYLKGLAGTQVGEAVVYDELANTTTRAVAGSRGPVAIAMSANVANQYGWYQIAGSAIVRVTGAAANLPLYNTATAGSPSTTVVATDKIDGAVTKTATGNPATGFATVQINRPCLNGNG
jgi:hypothetical protein